MFRRRSSANLIALLASPLATSGMSWDAEPASADMAEQIRTLREEVAELRATSQRSTTKSTAARDEVLLDAQRRSQTLPTDTTVAPLTAGVEKGKFLIRDAAGNFSISPVFQLQLRNVSNWSDSGDDEGYENGFEIRRAKFGAEGHAFSKDLGYKFVWATNRSGGSVFLEDAVISYRLTPEWKLVGGQFKDPVHHEELVSSTRRLAADRSIVNEILGGGATDRVQGVGLAYQRGPLATQAVFHDGINSDNTSFRQADNRCGVSAKRQPI